MFDRNKIGPVDEERLVNDLHQVYHLALRIELKNLSDTADQLRALADAVARLDGFVRHLRGKWFDGCDDSQGPVVTYRPRRMETRTDGGASR